MINDINQNLNSELKSFNDVFFKLLDITVEGYEEVLEYVYSSKGKRIRPIVGILLAKVFNAYNQNIEKFLLSIELIHNATLFHDDVIDDSDYRHNIPALHKKFSNKLAILTGDYFMATSLKNIYSLQNDKINYLFANFIQQICEGEIEQDIALNKIMSLENYLNKTRKKTGLLFELTTLGIVELCKPEKYKDAIIKFGQNFGILFQLFDDLKNFQQEKDKPALNDLKSGIITAPIIFLAQEKPEINVLVEQLKYDEVLKMLEKSNAINKTINLCKMYYQYAQKAIQCFPDNKYKNLLLNLLSEFRNN